MLFYYILLGCRYWNGVATYHSIHMYSIYICEQLTVCLNHIINLWVFGDPPIAFPHRFAILPTTRHRFEQQFEVYTFRYNHMTEVCMLEQNKFAVLFHPLHTIKQKSFRHQRLTPLQTSDSQCSSTRSVCSYSLKTTFCLNMSNMKTCLDMIMCICFL